MICCCASDTPMYAAGGTTGTGVSAVTDKIQMTAETSAAVTTANLTQARSQVSGAGNPSVAAYVGGGTTAASVFVVTADKITFSNDTATAVTTANLSQARSELSGLSERSTKAYFAGGLTNPNKVKTTDKLTFSGDSTSATTTADLSAVRASAAGMNGNSTKGYWGGGFTNIITTSCVTTTDKITFSGDSTSATASAALSSARAMATAGSDGSTKGYFAGGQTGGTNTRVDKITISTDTTASVTSASFGQYSGAAGSNANKLVCGGGFTNTTGITSACLKITFATDVVAGFGAALSTIRQFAAGVSYQAL